MDKKKKTLLIVGVILLIVNFGLKLPVLIAFMSLFGISLAVLVALARSSGKRGGSEQQVKVDTSVGQRDNVNPYSSTMHQTAQSIREGQFKTTGPQTQQFAGQPGQPGAGALGGQGGAQGGNYQYQSTYVQQAKGNPAQVEGSPVQQTADSFRQAAAPDAGNVNNIQRRKRTGDKEIDKLLDEEEKAIAEMRRLNEAILDEKVSGQIEHLEDVTQKIVDCIVEKPKKRTQVKKFFSYYLPTTLKLLNSYDRMDEVGISGANIDGTKGSIEALLDTALAAFDKELDALYGDEAIDVTSDIKVMESMLAQDGLMDDDIVRLLK
ncbi:MAG: 5-bromo-4-chloroindolyl phosphate hydrolysis family protein [Lachnospiraceae bacterium]|nr:5-bromo-4-chloroindolyl phosphate hydrolysis family protein [Lachnospiraceae bacterium]